ncbi:hypothetical protein GGTG_08045 [Gaeumannomyces tritici R3-111a-1]|uniref:Uncharacterized protein n=1 Tax=Gaeumannomyces tritici (strain R3-111a-1) TaxID=644352 RepID=J3P3F9_GAET3|nr:hypothetical protein GGTG_08045 [Gaeumannomyces tritici R3-111a-1]EJT74201.1 hypothetical protein GGTG_08045 [Gaeumannomyces tritici R3-111a-1]
MSGALHDRRLASLHLPDKTDSVPACRLLLLLLSNCMQTSVTLLPADLTITKRNGTKDRPSRAARSDL